MTKSSIREKGFSSDELRQRAGKLSIGLCYRYDGHALHPAFKDNTNQWMLTKNWGASSYSTLRDVSAALDELERTSATPGANHE